VLKVVSPHILHKTEASGVKVNIRDAQALHGAYKEMGQSVSAYLRLKGIKEPGAVWGYLVQSMAEGGKELILGSKYNPMFGPIMMVGMGGIYVEVMQDVSFGIPPITDAESAEMISSLKGYPILRGVRGEKGCDLDAVQEYIMRLAQLVSDFPQIKELDLNPVRTYPPGKSPVALDSRIIIG
jgi:acyl-CoA synthetase (NDP forming)